MARSSGGGMTRNEVQYLYINGAYFDGIVAKCASDYFGGETLAIDFAKLGKNFTRVFYYHALPSKQATESQEQYEGRKQAKSSEFHAIARIRGFHVREGVVRRGNNRNEQKKVDILIAVDMLAHTMRNNMDSAVLITGDLDFQPLLAALVDAGMYTILRSDPRTAAEDLMAAADESHPITIDNIYAWATDSFRAAYPFPHAFSNSSRIAKGALVATGQTVDGDSIGLFQNGSNFCVTLPDNRNKGYTIHIEHNERSILERYVSDTRCKFARD